MCLRNVLPSMKKGNLNVNNYMRKMKEISDALIGSGQTITNKELLNFILDGLGVEFDVVVDIITSKIDSLTDSIL